MKKISNEVKVGATVILTILVFIWLYSFLKGKNMFSSNATYYSVYDQISGLAESSPVEINGYKVGVVQSIKFIDDLSGRLLVTFSVGKDFKLPVNTIAEVVPVSVLGGMKVQFVYGDGPGTYNYGDTLKGRVAPSIMDELVPVKDKITGLVDVMDSVLSSVNEVFDTEFKKNLGGTMANLSNTTKSLDNVLGAKEKELRSTIENINKFSSMLSQNSGSMSKTLTNLESITDTLAAADIYASVMNLKTSLEKTSVMLENLNNGKGSAGQFLTNDTLYSNLTTSLGSLNELLTDMKENPKRYVHFSLFGKKNIPADK